MTSKILIVDDEKDMCWTLSKFLEKQGYATIAVQDGEAAIQKVITESLKLVLLDIQMPGKDGLKVLEEIRRFEKDLPVVLITGYGSPEVAAKAIQLGANDYLSKPFDNKTLLEMVRKNESFTAGREARTLYQTRVGSFSGQKGKLEELRRLPEPLVKKLEANLDEMQEPFFETLPSVQENKVPSTFISLHKLLLGLLLLLGISVYAMRAAHFKNPFKIKTASFTLDYSHPSAIALKEERVGAVPPEGGSSPVRKNFSCWTADWFSQTIYQHEPMGFAMQKSFPLKEIRPSGMAWIGNDLYLCDSWKKQNLKFSFDANSQSLKFVFASPSPGSSPSGLCWDGTYLWSCDLAAGRIYKHQIDEKLSVLEDYPSPGRSPMALGWDGKNLWSMDGSKDMIYKHRMDSELSVMAQYSLKAIFPNLKKVSGFLVTPETVWILSEDPPLVVQRDISLKIGSYIYSLGK